MAARQTKYEPMGKPAVDRMPGTEVPMKDIPKVQSSSMKKAGSLGPIARERKEKKL